MYNKAYNTVFHVVPYVLSYCACILSFGDQTAYRRLHGVFCVIRPTCVVTWFAGLALSALLIIQYLALKTRTSPLRFTTAQLEPC